MNEDKKTANASEQESGDSQRRVGGFPTVSLPKAIGMMQKVWEKEKRNAAPASAIVEHWGYAPKSSGGFQALASLKRYGLLEEVPGTAQRSLKVSQTALDLLKYENTDPAEYRKRLKTLALLPDWNEEIWNKYHHELPSDKTLETFLVFDRHLTEESARLFIRLYKETISFAKLTEADSVGETTPPSDEEISGKPENPPKNDKIKENTVVSTTINVGELAIPIGDKAARIPFPMSEEDFELFSETIKLWKKKLVRTLKPIPPAIQFPANAVWSNGDHDKRVKVVSIMGEKDGETYYQSEDGTGIPESQLAFD